MLKDFESIDEFNEWSEFAKARNTCLFVDSRSRLLVVTEEGLQQIKDERMKRKSMRG